MSHQWYYIKPGLVDDETVGPISEPEFTKIVREGKVKRESLVSSPTRTKGQWVALSAFPAAAKIWNEGQSERKAAKAAESQRRHAEKDKQRAARSAERQQARAEHHKEKQSRQDRLSRVSDCPNLDLVEKLISQTNAILTSSEAVEYIVVQSKPVAIKTASVVCTGKRLIFCHPKLMGRFAFTDYLWRDLGDAHLSHDLIGSTFTAKHVSGTVVSMDYLPRASAEKLYRIAQSQEEEATEERRRREIEEKQAGAMQVQVGTPQLAVPSAPQYRDPSARLAALKAMLTQGLISEDEYNAKKADILGEL